MVFEDRGRVMELEDLELSIRSNNALRSAGITTVEALVGLGWE